MQTPLFGNGLLNSPPALGGGVKLYLLEEPVDNLVTYKEDFLFHCPSLLHLILIIKCKMTSRPHVNGVCFPEVDIIYSHMSLSNDKVTWSESYFDGFTNYWLL